ncbi:MAG: UTP--glucose-1-phosphate uridylyltransferase [bacterium]|nr:UTP--glucose-1-phosphate uridylyltransferase [bacterium]
MPRYKQVKKAVIAAAGLGTRFLPYTKAMPKEMLPVIDKPVVQLIVEEAVAAGVTDIIIVTGYSKRPIEDHFDRAIELEVELKKKGKEDFAKEIKHIAEMANFIYIRQKGVPTGNARPVLNARHLLGEDPFFVFFADDFYRSKVPRAVQLLNVYNRTGKSVISAQKVNKSDADKYGMIKLGEERSDGAFEVKELIEKPGEKNTPSDIASVGGYLLTPEIWDHIGEQHVSERGELELSQGIHRMSKKTQVYCKVVDGVYHDTGNKLGYLKALVDTGLEHEKLGKDFRQYLTDRLQS